MGIERLLAVRHLYAIRRAVGQQFPALLIVLEIRHHDLAEHLFVHGGIEDGAQHLDPPIEIARHHVGRRDVDGGLGMRQAVAATEAIDAAVLEKAAHDRLDPDVLRQARQARPQAADPAHDEVDGNSGQGRLIKKVDDLGIDQCVVLHPDRGGTSLLGMGDLLTDMLANSVPQRERRHRHLLELGRRRIAGHVIENARDIARDHRIGGEERQIRVAAGGDRMVVAGADMHIGGERAALAAHHERQLGVGLELDEAEYDLHTGALQITRPADIRLLVEARLELDQRGD